jgi:hypothetical protein
MMFKPDREALAWAAGFFDGEGSIYIDRDTRRNGRLYKAPTVSVNQAGEHSRDLLERFKSSVGGLGSVTGPYRSKKFPTRKEYHQWQACGFMSSQAIIAMLWEFLGPVKRAKATRVLRECREHDPRVLV